ncbi:MAG: hypothetical protein UW43_C0004G0025 [Candidatus Yanofskybacteria bacterium GW2011_GWA1_44_21]|uniref:Uncharacterized protein n=2 Tax=Candidatus Yanofskyibacteriota TaxID=1752733 RepID=A0A1F8GZJ6_9BACT|nr:MAG: hypothetical protein UW14_C0005G0011 [Candidatus Yanofskybacteria bacterium GW2011_GWA2_44_10]KKT50593.1 MAG: hypothetical protein UW43_C0004G0025 [Candidatus Yanofskybacteria bacterium GW2011_GWA1_44_21]KKT90107.1 MAG: hypothetical protein UW90_C0006G0007 [Candidatus Yanofskybacteria bacterium GW2011_GWB1_45_11]OGN02773.1 MAG: hypothetical protein A2657_01360 [Candidatus Yanofskybacteria bacterium RIFCSPHIGHO2_01_FULL_44_110b]OGN14646.1 MAG: hypothetical protein A3C01_03105 [Candidatus
MTEIPMISFALAILICAVLMLFPLLIGVTGKFGRGWAKKMAESLCAKEWYVKCNDLNRKRSRLVLNLRETKSRTHMVLHLPLNHPDIRKLVDLQDLDVVKFRITDQPQNFTIPYDVCAWIRLESVTPCPF